MNYMNQTIDLNRVSNTFVMALGSRALQDIDTPSFMRKKHGISLYDGSRSPNAGRVVEADKKILDFLTVIKRKDFALSA